MYPVLMAVVMPVTLLSYEERCKWDVCSRTMPYKKSWLVSEKFLFMCGILVIVTILTTVAKVFNEMVHGKLLFTEILQNQGVFFSVGLIAGSVLLTIIYKFGVEKGRMAYYGILIAMCIGITCFDIPMEFERIKMSTLWLIVLAADVIILAASWKLSMYFNQKKEF